MRGDAFVLTFGSGSVPPLLFISFAERECDALIEGRSGRSLVTPRHPRFRLPTAYPPFLSTGIGEGTTLAAEPRGPARRSPRRSFCRESVHFFRQRREHRSRRRMDVDSARFAFVFGFMGIPFDTFSDVKHERRRIQKRGPKSICSIEIISFDRRNADGCLLPQRHQTDGETQNWISYHAASQSPLPMRYC